MSADLIVLAGRILLGGMFVVAGLRHLMIVPVLSVAVAARGMPFPRTALLASTAFQIGAGLALVLGFFTSWAALGLILFTIVARSCW
jgi:putative oxidoreductase